MYKIVYKIIIGFFLFYLVFGFEVIILIELEILFMRIILVYRLEIKIILK